jgi:hypothetical protein
LHKSGAAIGDPRNAGIGRNIKFAGGKEWNSHQLVPVPRRSNRIKIISWRGCLPPGLCKRNINRAEQAAQSRRHKKKSSHIKPFFDPLFQSLTPLNHLLAISPTNF